MFFARDAALAPSAVQDLVARLRAQGRVRVDQLQGAEPVLPAPCDN